MSKILESISSDVLSESVKESIVESFNTAVTEAVEQRIEERVTLECENLSAKIDQEHTAKVEKLVESIDKTHTEMFKSVINKLDASHTNKLKHVNRKFQTELTENAKQFQDDLVKKVSKFLDIKVNEMVPESHLKEAVENIQSRKLVAEMKKLLSFDPDSVNSEIKTALKEGYDAIESLKSELNEKAKQNLLLSEEVENIKSKVLLENKTKDLPVSKRKFIDKFMQDKNSEYILNNFDYVVEMFEENENSQKEVLVESEKVSSSRIVADTPPSQIKSEVIQESSSGDEVSDYISQMFKQDNFYK